jgi:hypothetical protein
MPGPPPPIIPGYGCAHAAAENNAVAIATVIHLRFMSDPFELDRCVPFAFAFAMPIIARERLAALTPVKCAPAKMCRRVSAGVRETY